MSAGSSERRTVKIRRRGRHAAPSQVEKVAAQAGKAAPAVAIAGALVAVPTGQSALAATVATGQTATTGHSTTTGQTVTVTHKITALDVYTTAKSAKSTTKRMYTVRSGDSLSSIAERFYQKTADWQWLYHVNSATISDPDMIYPGQRISVPLDPPANYTLPDYQPKHAATPSITASASRSEVSSSSSSSGSASGSSSSHTTVDSAGSSTSTPAYVPPSGQYSCSSLEELWDQAGGNPAEAFIAAEIATAESGGNPNAISPTADYGLWQINASNGSLATLDPYENAKSAIDLSDDGANWGAWTTYTSGAYIGRC
ncbi:MAG TPA: LysM peptidoglycan-binding domain-containing protein [Trebonia sp.]|nr:LysM peptidoglycan-binding domain-containing protein [Trebonia sp.]